MKLETLTVKRAFFLCASCLFAGSFVISAACSQEAAKKEIDGIVNVVRGWRANFIADGVSAQDVDYIQQAFLPDGFFFEAPTES